MHPTAEWKQLQDRFCRKRELYEMEWGDDLDLNGYMIAAAPFGGPIAMIRDDSKLVALTETSVKPSVTIYTSAGSVVSSFLWDRLRMIKMGWTNDENLVCVQEDGTVYLYTVHGAHIKEFSMMNDGLDSLILDAHIWGGGVVVLTTEFKLKTASLGGEQNHVRNLADPELTEPPSSWTIIPPQYTLSGTVEVVLATGSTLYIVDGDDYQDQLLIKGPFTRMAVSADGGLLALFTHDGNIMVITTDIKRNLVEMETQSGYPPTQLVWCGGESVVMSWDHMLLMVGRGGMWIKFTYEKDACTHLITEVDGMRIISNNKCELLQFIPKAVEDIFRIGSTAPSAMLFDALEHFESKSPKADENIRAIKDELTEAVDGCIEAAGHEFSEALQKQLLRAASFGKSFLDFYDSDSFVDMCRTLRVLNAVRHYTIGVPITYQQFRHLTPEVLINRLTNRRHHLLAYRVSEFLKLPTDRVLVHWACEKVKQSAQEEEELCDSIVEKLREVPGISYVEIADTAYRSGRPELATMLLDFEPRAADQVPLLLSMKEDELALIKGIESGDTDLVYLVLVKMQERHSTGDFFNLIRNKPLACDLLVAYCKSENTELLKDYFYSSDQPHESANIMVMDAYKCDDLTQRMSGLRTAIGFYKDYKDHQFEAKMTEELYDLLGCQMKLTKDTNHNFVDLSLSDTIYQCILYDQAKMAKKLQRDFGVPDKRFWWIKIRALAHNCDWDGLEEFSKSKRSPIGYEPFVDVCIEARMVREAAKYVPRVSNTERRCGYYFQVGMFKQTAEIAFQLGHIEMLQQILEVCKDRDVNNSVHTMIAKLTKG